MALTVQALGSKAMPWPIAIEGKSKGAFDTVALIF